MPEHDSQNANAFSPAKFALSGGLEASSDQSPVRINESALQSTTTEAALNDARAMEAVDGQVLDQSRVIRTAQQWLPDQPPRQFSQDSFAPPVVTQHPDVHPTQNTFNFTDQSIAWPAEGNGPAVANPSFAPPADRSTLPFVPRADSINDSPSGLQGAVQVPSEKNTAAVDAGHAAVNRTSNFATKTKLIDLNRRTAQASKPSRDNSPQVADAPTEFLSREPFSDQFLVVPSRSGRSPASSAKSNLAKSSPSKIIFLVSQESSKPSPSIAQGPPATLSAPLLRKPTVRPREGQSPASNQADVSLIMPKAVGADFVARPPQHALVIDNPLPPPESPFTPSSPVETDQTHAAQEPSVENLVDATLPNSLENSDVQGEAFHQTQDDAFGETVLDQEEVAFSPGQSFVKTQQGFTESDFIALESKETFAQQSSRPSSAGRYVNEVNQSSAEHSANPFRVANHRRSETDRNDVTGAGQGLSNTRESSQPGNRIILPNFRLRQSNFSNQETMASTVQRNEHPRSADHVSETPWLSAWWMLIVIVPIALYLSTTKLFRDQEEDGYENDSQDIDWPGMATPVKFGSDFGVIGRSKSDAIYGTDEVSGFDEHDLERIDKQFTIDSSAEPICESIFLEIPTVEDVDAPIQVQEISANQSPNFQSTSTKRRSENVDRQKRAS